MPKFSNVAEHPSEVVAQQQQNFQYSPNLDPTPAEARAQDINNRAVKTLQRDKECLENQVDRLKKKIKDLSQETRSHKRFIADKECTIEQQAKTIQVLTTETHALLASSRVVESPIPGKTMRAAEAMKDNIKRLTAQGEKLFNSTMETVRTPDGELDLELLELSLQKLSLDFITHQGWVTKVNRNVSIKVDKRDTLFTSISSTELQGKKLESTLNYLGILKMTPEKIRQLKLKLENLKAQLQELPSNYATECPRAMYQEKLSLLEGLKENLLQLMIERSEIQTKEFFDDINPKADCAIVGLDDESIKALHAYNQVTEEALRQGVIEIKNGEKQLYTDLRNTTATAWNSIGEAIAQLEAELFISEIALNLQLKMYELQRKAVASSDQFATMKTTQTPLDKLEGAKADKSTDFTNKIVKAADLHVAYQKYSAELRQRIDKEKNKSSLTQELAEAALNPATPEANVKASLVKLHETLEKRYTEVLRSLDGGFKQFNDAFINYGQQYGNYLAAIAGGNKTLNSAAWPYGIMWNEQSRQASRPIETKKAWEEEIKKTAALPEEPALQVQE